MNVPSLIVSSGYSVTVEDYSDKKPVELARGKLRDFFGGGLDGKLARAFYSRGPLGIIKVLDTIRPLITDEMIIWRRYGISDICDLPRPFYPTDICPLDQYLDGVDSSVLLQLHSRRSIDSFAILKSRRGSILSRCQPIAMQYQI